MKMLNKLLVSLSLATNVIYADEITIDVSSDVERNVWNLENLVGTTTPSSGEFTIILPPAEYGNLLVNDELRTGSFPQPYTIRSSEKLDFSSIERITAMPASGAIIHRTVSPSEDSTWEDIMFQTNGGLAPSVLSFSTNNVTMRRCYVTTAQEASQPLTIGAYLSPGHIIVGINIEDCVFEGFTRGVDIARPDNRWRRCAFVNNFYGFRGNADVDMGTVLEPGDNIFYGNTYHARLTSGDSISAIWGFFYDREGRQQTTEEAIRGGIQDVRPGTAGTHLNALNPMQIIPFHTTPAFQTTTPVLNWSVYR